MDEEAVVRGFAPLVEVARRKAVRYFRKTFSRKSDRNIFQPGRARLKNQYNFGRGGEAVVRGFAPLVEVAKQKKRPQNLENVS